MKHIKLFSYKAINAYLRSDFDYTYHEKDFQVIEEKTIETWSTYSI